ncbi:MAG: carboxylesterase family protein [Spirochaetia bacterium]|jgi:para-nitrobenzyl esterase
MKHFTRRLTRILPILCAVFAASCLTQAPPAPLQEPGAWVGSPVVLTRYGEVKGYPDAGDSWRWAAIPFARPPVRELRWRAPVDPMPWNGIRDVRKFNGGCTQFSPVFPRHVVGSEDCLYLNVWRPRDDSTRLPVYMWIHGGGNSMGSATMVPDYFGTGIAGRSHMVFVSLNYRLGPFGWFTHPALREGASPFDASGNYGTLDIIKGLQWVQENIAAFGGDPGNVMIAGESAGGFNVLSLLISLPAKGLFHRALSESGAAITHGIDEADARSEKVLEELLIRDHAAKSRQEAARAAASMGPGEIRRYLRAKSDREILGCYNSLIMGIIDNPAVLRDGAVIARDGFDALVTGDYPGKVPLIIGSNADELKLFLYFSHRIPWDSDLYQVVSRYGSERWKASGVDEVARRLSAHADQPPVYSYQFSWGAMREDGGSMLPDEWGRKLGSFHSLDIPFFLGTETLEGVMQLFLFTRKNEAGRRALSRDMMTYVAQFIRTGDPNPLDADLPRWTPWTHAPGAPKFIVLDAGPDEPSIAMSSSELTDAGVMDSLRETLPEPLRSQTLKALEESALPASIR